MKSLVIIAHGSRRRESNEEIMMMVERIRDMDQTHFDLVQHAFLEICEPSLPDSIAKMIEKGAREIIVYPFFLNSGNHVSSDIPEMVSKLNALYPECDIRLLAHFGKQEDIASLIINHVNR